jgi:hypothetical protein
MGNSGGDLIIKQSTKTAPDLALILCFIFILKKLGRVRCEKYVLLCINKTICKDCSGQVQPTLFKGIFIHN